MMDSFFALQSLSPTAGGWLDYAKTLLVLAGICLLAIITSRVFIPKVRALGGSSARNIQVIGQCPLEPRKTLYLVKAGKTVVLLASSVDAVHFMTTVDGNDFAEDPASTMNTPEQPSAFRRVASAIADRSSRKSI
jgi:flagellar biogenesis protein FliO